MISDIAAWLFALFVIDPLQAEMRERLEGANVPVICFNAPNRQGDTQF